MISSIYRLIFISILIRYLGTRPRSILSGQSLQLELRFHWRATWDDKNTILISCRQAAIDEPAIHIWIGGLRSIDIPVGNVVPFLLFNLKPQLVG